MTAETTRLRITAKKAEINITHKTNTTKNQNLTFFVGVKEWERWNIAKNLTEIEK